MRKFLIWAIPVAALVTFVLIMQSGNFMKKPWGKNDDVPRAIDELIEAVNNGNWDEADKKLENLKDAWNNVLKRVQFCSEREEINDISACIARLKGAIAAKDKSDALMELYETYCHWEDLGS